MGEEILTGLETIDWTVLQDAYGSAAQVPNRLRALLSNDDAVRSEALIELFGSVWHQGTIYSVSAHVIPFLVELLSAPEVKDKPSIVVLLANIAGGRGYYEAHETILQKLAKRPLDFRAKRGEEMRTVEAVRLAASPHIPHLIRHLTHPEPAVRIAVTRPLPLYPEHAAAAAIALEQVRRSESHPEVLEVFEEALATISGRPD